MKELLLLHGWGFGSAAWTPLVPLLARHFRVRLGHLPGYGETVDVSSLPPGTAVCAWSLGGQSALRLAATYPEHIAQLILIGTSPRFVCGPDWSAGLAPQVLSDFATSVASDPGLALKRFAALINHGDDDARTATRTLLTLAESRWPSADVLAEGLQALRDDDLRALVPRIAQPTLLVHGERDALMPVAAAQWLATHLPAAKLAILPGRGHAPFVTAAEACAKSIQEFLVG